MQNESKVRDVLADRLRARARLAGLHPDEIEDSICRLHGNILLRCLVPQGSDSQQVIVRRLSNSGITILSIGKAIEEGWIIALPSVSGKDIDFLPGKAESDLIYEIDGDDIELDFALPEDPITLSSRNVNHPLSAFSCQLQAAGLDEGGIECRLEPVEVSWHDPSRKQLVPEIDPVAEIRLYDEGPNELLVAIDQDSDWMFVRLTMHLSDSDRVWPTSEWERGSVFAVTLAPGISTAAQLSGLYLVVFLADDGDNQQRPLLRVVFRFSD